MVAKIKRLSINEVNRRISFLADFRERVGKYFQNVEYEWPRMIREKEAAHEHRLWINRNISRAEAILYEAGLKAIAVCRMGYTIERNVDLLDNIFLLHEYKIQPKILIDILERAIGRYEEEIGPAQMRTYNPFWWLGITIGWVISLPIVLLGLAGFDTSRLERYPLMKLIKATWGLLIIIVTVLPILELFGYTELLRKALRNVGFPVR